MIKYGSQVAFLSEGVIRFGVISEIVTRLAKEETTEYVVRVINAIGGEPVDVIVAGEEKIADLHTWNRGDAILSLARKSGLYQWAEAESKKILDPDEPVPIAVPAPSLAELDKAEKNIPF